MRLIVLAALAASLVYGQDKSVTAKPEPSKAGAAPAPKLETAKLWRLLSRAQTLRVQLNQSPQGKEADAADAEVQKAQQELNAQCSAVGMVLGFEQDAASPNFQDLKCVAAPPPQAPPKAAETPAKGK